MNDTVLVLSLASAIVAGTPLLFATLGEIIAERSGVMNLGVEGMMLVGGVAGFWAGVTTGSLGLSLVVGAAAGGAMALVHAFLAVSLRVDQTVSGLALVIIGGGISAFFGSSGTPSLVQVSSGIVTRPVLPAAWRDLPGVGPIVFGHDATVYLAVLATVLTTLFLSSAPGGLSLRAVGEDPGAADVAGVNVRRTRYLATITGGMGAGIGGAYLTVVVLGTWQGGVTAGIGWIAVALVILAGWSPVRALVGAYVFGGLRGLSFTLQLAGVDISSEFLAMIPFVAAFVVIVVSAAPKRGRRSSAPSALGQPYSRELR